MEMVVEKISESESLTRKTRYERQTLRKGKT